MEKVENVIQKHLFHFLFLLYMAGREHHLLLARCFRFPQYIYTFDTDWISQNTYYMTVSSDEKCSRYFGTM